LLSIERGQIVEGSCYVGMRSMECLPENVQGTL
jgi:hypothetical protein